MMPINDILIYILFLIPVTVLIVTGVKEFYRSFKDEKFFQGKASQRLTDLENKCDNYKEEIHTLKRYTNNITLQMNIYNKNYKDLQDRIYSLEKKNSKEEKDIQEARQAIEFMIKDLDKIKEDLNFVMKVS